MWNTAVTTLLLVTGWLISLSDRILPDRQKSLPFELIEHAIWESKELQSMSYIVPWWACTYSNNLKYYVSSISEHIEREDILKQSISIEKFKYNLIQTVLTYERGDI
jgi:hypothetical protein